MSRRKALKPAAALVEAPPLLPSDRPIKASEHRARQAARVANDLEESKSVSSTTLKLKTADDILRDYEVLRGIYDSDSKFAARIDAAVAHENTAVDRAAWARQLGIDPVAGPREILDALATRLGIKRAARPAASASAKAKSAPKPARAMIEKPGGKRGRQAVDTAALQGQMLAALKSGAMTSEALRKKLAADKPLYKKAADALLSGKKIKKSGERRNTELRLA